MAYYYVKSGGSATGDTGRYANKQTGSFSTIVAYPSLTGLLAATSSATTVPTYGDYILVSDLHYENPGTNEVYLNHRGYTIAVVSDSDIATYSKATSPILENSSRILSCTPSGSYNYLFDSAYLGMYFKNNYDKYMATTSGESAIYRDCTFETYSATNRYTKIQGFSATVTAYSCNFIFPTASGILVDKGAKAIFNDCTFSGSCIANKDNYYYGAHFEFNNCDLSSLAGADLTPIGFTYTAGTIDVTFNRCNIDNTSTFATTNPVVTRNFAVHVNGLSDNPHYFYHKYYGGEVMEDTTASLLSSTYNGADKFSVLIQTNSNNSLRTPVPHRLMIATNEDLTSGATYRVHLTATNQLTSADVIFYASYNSASGSSYANTVSSYPSNILSPSPLFTDTASWGGSLGSLGNNYYIDVIVPSVQGVSSSTISFNIEVSIPSTDIAIDGFVERV